MMKGRFLVVLGTLIVALLACEKEELHTPATDNEVNQWIERTLRDHYLWYDDMPAEGAVDRGSAPEEFFLSLLSDQDGKEQAEGHHYFSTLQRAATKSITDENDSYGFDFAIGTLQDNDGTHKIALVLYVLKDSPAERAGLRRGDWIVGVNGSYGTLQDYDQLRSGGSATFQLAESVEGSATSLRLGREIAIEPSTVVEDIPILKDSIYQVGTRRVGYLMYNHFELGPDENDLDDTRYQQQLEELFAQFKQAGVNEFVLDLRYNGGGNVLCAQALASFLSPEAALGETFCLMEYNDKHTDENNAMPLLRTTEILAGNLDLDRLFVLTGSTTASSSELVINTLIPYLGRQNVRLIGRQTFGKTVGATVYNESERYGWILSPITFRIYNRDHEADYADGFAPDVSINEFAYPLAPLGDPRDPLLGYALAEISGIASPALRATSPSSGPDIRYEPPRSLRDNVLVIHDNK